MNIRFLETFVWLAKLQNFRLTAQKLQTTQAAVSSRIASLEENFGTLLFFRNSRSASLTPAGKALLSFAERIVLLGDDMRREIVGRDLGPGRLRIGAVESAVYSWFPMLMRLINERYPTLEIELTSDTTVALSRLLVNDELDLILRTESSNLPAFENVPLCSLPVRWMASPTLGLGGRLLTVAELATHPIICFAKHTVTHTAVERVFARSTGLPARINGMSSLGAIIRMVSDGFGVAPLPAPLLERELNDGTLEMLQLPDEGWDLPAFSFVASYLEQGPPIAVRIASLAREVTDGFVASLGDRPASGLSVASVV